MSNMRICIYITLQVKSEVHERQTLSQVLMSFCPQSSAVKGLPLPLRDLSQSTEAQRAALSQGESSGNTQCSVEAATDSFYFVKKAHFCWSNGVRRPGAVCRG